MKNFGILIAVLGLFSVSHSYASTELTCEASGKIDGISFLRISDLKSQVCVLVNDRDLHCAKGTKDDSSIEVKNNLEIGFGTTRIVIEKSTSPSGSYTMKKVFACDWVNGEDRCAPYEPEVTIQSESIICN